MKEFGKFVRRWFLGLTLLSPLPYILTPFAARFFPTAGDALKEGGVNPAVAEELAPRQKIRVLKESGAGFLMPNAWLPIASIPMTTILTLLGAPNASTLRKGQIFNLSENDIVYMSTIESCPPREYIQWARGNIKREDIPDDKISQKELAACTLLHEIRHCSEDNKNLDSPLLQEGDADFYAITRAAREFNNPEIIRWRFNMRAGMAPGTDEHDVSLYLDSKLNEGLPLSADYIEKANVEAGAFLKENPAGDISALSPLARKRVEFYQEAQRYFRTPAPLKKLPARAP